MVSACFLRVVSVIQSESLVLDRMLSLTRSRIPRISGIINVSSLLSDVSSSVGFLSDQRRWYLDEQRVDQRRRSSNRLDLQRVVSSIGDSRVGLLASRLSLSLPLFLFRSAIAYASICLEDINMFTFCVQTKPLLTIIIETHRGKCHSFALRLVIPNAFGIEKRDKPRT